MKKLLLITGDLATGKSTFANILSKRYDTNVFFKDSIKEVREIRLVLQIEKKTRNYQMLQWN